MTHELIWRIEVRGIGKGGRLGDETRYDIQAVVKARGAEVKDLVLGIIALIAIVAQTSEHGTVVHVVAVDAGVLIREIGGIAAVDEDRAVCVHLPVIHVIEIIEVVFCISDRIVDNGVGTVDPCHDIRILSTQTRKVNVQGAYLGIDAVTLGLGALGRGCRSGGGRGHCHKVVGYLIVDLFSLLVAYDGGDDLIAAVEKYTQQDNTEHNQNELYRAALFPSCSAASVFVQKIRLPLQSGFSLKML